MLEVRDLSAIYGKHRALEGVSLRVDPGEIVVILGANGAGKSTLLRAIGGICDGAVSGHVGIDGHPILGAKPDVIVEHGLALVPEGRGIFGDLTVRENLTLGAYANRARSDEAANLDRVLTLFPRLGERQRQIARTMSGGEQQMVAIGRAMMSNPQILMLDEPSLGLSPLLCKELFANLGVVRKAGIGILLVEQNARQSLAIADRGYLLENARIIHEDVADKLMHDPVVQKAYLGGTGKAVTAQPEPVKTTAVKPPPIQPRPGHPAPRMTADQLLGTSIADIVAKASRPASVQTSTGTIPQAGQRDRLHAALADIERAAQRARTSNTTGLSRLDAWRRMSRKSD